MSPYDRSNECPNAEPTASSARTPWSVTSGPIPSPPMTAILNSKPKPPATKTADSIPRKGKARGGVTTFLPYREKGPS